MIKEITITWSEGTNKVNEYLPETFNSLELADRFVNGLSHIDGKFGFVIYMTNGDSYEGKGYKGKELVNIRKDVIEYLEFVVSGKDPYSNQQKKLEAEKYLLYFK